ncbi:hypothetical protein [Aequorivita aquimaris]|uniref:hypothetical protein n=1 Tax=Aequorivita aquimaris TaxID=1548749 RepID=UPI00195CEE9A|nr:hypothetical protein [Aequorivita aquimaris]
MKKTLAIILLLLFCENIYSQQTESQSEIFNSLINYIPSALNNDDFVSDLEKRYKTKFNYVNVLFTVALSEKELKLTEKDILIFEKHLQDLAIELYKEGKTFLLKGYMSHGCNPISSEMINEKNVKVLIWCYGDMVKDDKLILRFFEIFNNQMKILI